MVVALGVKLPPCSHDSYITRDAGCTVRVDQVQELAHVHGMPERREKLDRLPPQPPLPPVLACPLTCPWLLAKMLCDNKPLRRGRPLTVDGWLLPPLLRTLPASQYPCRHLTSGEVAERCTWPPPTLPPRTLPYGARCWLLL